LVERNADRRCLSLAFDGSVPDLLGIDALLPVVGEFPVRAEFLVTTGAHLL
jgi:hypothetical protein